MLIEETLKIDIPDIDPFDPGRGAELRMHLITKAIESFTRHVINKHTSSVEEGEVLQFELALKLLTRFQLSYHTKLLAARLKDRRAG